MSTFEVALAIRWPLGAEGVLFAADAGEANYAFLPALPLKLADSAILLYTIFKYD